MLSQQRSGLAHSLWIRRVVGGGWGERAASLILTEYQLVEPWLNSPTVCRVSFYHHQNLRLVIRQAGSQVASGYQQSPAHLRKVSRLLILI